MVAGRAKFLALPLPDYHYLLPMLPAAVLPADLSASHDLLHTLLEVSLTAVNVLLPLYDPAGELVDFALVYVNPAGQRMNGLPEHPDGTLLGRFPHALATGIFDYYRRVYENGATDEHNVNYQADGLGNYFLLAAQRSGELLVVSFTDTSDQPRTPVEEVLRQNQARQQAYRAEIRRAELEGIFAQAPVGLVLFQGSEYRIDLANSMMGQIWGRPVAQVLGQPVFEAMPDLKQQGFEDILADVYYRGIPYSLWELPVTMARTHTNQPARGYFNVIYQPHRDQQGDIVAIVCLVIEVTDQVAARQQVQTLNEELAAINEELQASNDEYQQVNIALSEAQEQLQQLNQELEKRVLLRTQQVQHLNEKLAATNAKLTATNDEYQAANLALSATQHQLQQLNQELEARVHARTQELTQAQTEAETQRHRLAQLVVEAPAMIAISRGPEHVVELANDDFRALFGGREMVGQTYRQAVPELIGQPFYALLDEVYRTGETYYGFDQPATLDRTNSGRLIDVYVTFIYQATRDAQGQVDGIMIFATEVTEQVRARQQLEQLNQELDARVQERTEELAAINEKLTAINEELNESNTQLTRTNVDLDTFVYTASHDLKAPISNIESIVMALRATLPPAVQQAELVAHLLDLLDQTVTRFQFTIGQLTDITKLQLAHAGPAEPVMLADVVEGVRLDLAPAIQAAGTQLTAEVAPELVVSFSPANLRSVVYNLLSNAVKYCAPDRPSLVQVRAEQTSQGVVLEVEDNGLGMSEVQQRQLFGLFQRLHTHVEGTGVGLYISKRLVENAGGTIAVRSQPDRGTTFTITFPA